MKIKIDEARKISKDALINFGFSEYESQIITENLISAELAGRKPHGLNKLAVIKKVLANKFDENSKYFDYIELDENKKIEVIKESSSHLYLNSNFRTGYVAIGESLKKSIENAKKVPVFTTSIKNMGFASGYIGAYAKLVADNDLVYIGFHNSSGGLNYYGSKLDPLGTNPITIGLPSNKTSVIIDTSMAKLNWNDIEKAKVEKVDLPSGVAVDVNGNDTINPTNAFSVKSIEGHKGTALAYGVELLAGAISSSRVDFSNFGGWGSLYIIINPEFFAGTEKIKELVANSTDFIKTLGENVYFPGEQSSVNTKLNSVEGWIEVSEKLLENIKYDK